MKIRPRAFEALKRMRGRWVAAFALMLTTIPNVVYSQQNPDQSQKPNILVIMGDDIGWFNPSCYNRGMMGYETPNIDRIAKEGALFTCWYGQQSCTAGRAAFVTGQSPIRTGLTKVGIPGAEVGLRPEDPSVAELLKPLGYATGQFGKNHLGDTICPSRENRRMCIRQLTVAARGQSTNPD
jgi:arylsulfatase A-like enzyme